MIHILDQNEMGFPKVELAHESGILAIGGDLSTKRLMSAYSSGIFPWYEDGEPITWWAPAERMVLFLEELKVSKSMRQIINSKKFRVTKNANFSEVISNCQTVNRSAGPGTWITDSMREAYIDLHKEGVAHSIEVWQEDKLVGGLYGIDCNGIFCGESMFSLVSNASKVAFISLVELLKKSNYKLLDCQVYNSHLASLGAREISREEFMNILRD